jgi:hypothetical protein
MSQVELVLQSETMTDAAMQARMRQLSREMQARADVKTEQARGPAQAGAKGEPITIGALLVTFISSGAAVAALNVLKSWIEKDKSLSFTIKKADGTEITVNATNMEEAEKFAQSLGGAG